MTVSVDGVGVNWSPTVLGYSGAIFGNSLWDTEGVSNDAGTDNRLSQFNFTALLPSSTEVTLDTTSDGCPPGACGLSSLGGDLDTGDVKPSVNVVPIPAAVWLFGAGLFWLVGIARRK
jgi:hypothetical protein